MPRKLSRTDKLCLAVVVCIFMAGVALLLLSAAIRSDTDGEETERYSVEKIYLEWPDGSGKPPEGTGIGTGETDSGGTGTGTGSGTGTGTGTGYESRTESRTEGDTREPDTNRFEETTQIVLKEIVLTPVPAEKKFNYLPLRPSGEVTGFELYESQGYTYRATVSGVRVDPGISPSTIEEIELYDPTGRNVTSEFHIILNEGTIHVYRDIYIFQSASISKPYDGTPLTARDCEDPMIKVPQDAPYAFSYSWMGSQTRAGICRNAFDVRIIDMNNFYGWRDVTDEYKIVKMYGTLEVTRAEITVKAGDAQKVYDGEPLTCPDWALVEGTLTPGDSIVHCPVVGEQTRPGRSENVVDLGGIRIVNERGEDITGNYAIRTVAGTLRVTRS